MKRTHFVTSVLESHGSSFLALMKMVSSTPEMLTSFNVFLCFYRQKSLIKVLFY